MQQLIKSSTKQDFYRELLMSLITLVILMIMIRYIWNNVFVKYITVVKPIDSFVDTLLMAVGLWILLK